MTNDDLHLTFAEGAAEPQRKNQESRTAIDARFRRNDEWLDRFNARCRERQAEFRRQRDVVDEKIEA